MQILKGKNLKKNMSDDSWYACYIIIKFDLFMNVLTAITGMFLKRGGMESIKETHLAHF